MAKKKSKQGSHTVDQNLCPCGTALPYLQCCGRWHQGPEHLQAPTAEALMRSRYSAFVRHDPAYLLATWHPSTRPATLELDPGLKWLGLEVREHALLADDRAQVAFIARARDTTGRAFRQQERSGFVREAGQWWYVAGEP